MLYAVLLALVAVASADVLDCCIPDQYSVGLGMLTATNTNVAYDFGSSSISESSATVGLSTEQLLFDGANNAMQFIAPSAYGDVNVFVLWDYATSYYYGNITAIVETIDGFCLAFAQPTNAANYAKYSGCLADADYSVLSSQTVGSTDTQTVFLENDSTTTGSEDIPTFGIDINYHIMSVADSYFTLSEDSCTPVALFSDVVTDVDETIDYTGSFGSYSSSYPSYYNADDDEKVADQTTTSTTSGIDVTEEQVAASVTVYYNFTKGLDQPITLPTYCIAPTTSQSGTFPSTTESTESAQSSNLSAHYITRMKEIISDMFQAPVGPHISSLHFASPMIEAMKKWNIARHMDNALNAEE